MAVNHAKEFLIYVLYFHTFLSELQMAPIIPISGLNVPNLVQALLRTCYLLIWPRQFEVWRSGLTYSTASNMSKLKFEIVHILVILVLLLLNIGGCGGQPLCSKSILKVVSQMVRLCNYSDLPNISTCTFIYNLIFCPNFLCFLP